MLLNPWISPWTAHVARLERELARVFQNGGEPTLDVWTGENAVRVALRAPGYAPETIDVALDGDVLTLQGTRKTHELAEGERWHLHERDTEGFTRSVQLPFRVEQDQVAARYEHGVLWVDLPRSHAERAKKITIRTSNGHNPS